MVSLSSESSTKLETEKVFDYEDLWNPKPFKGEDYWFLNTGKIINYSLSLEKRGV